MTEQTTSFGYWLRRRRRALDLTQDELAQAVSCSHFAIRKIEADERRPSKHLAARLAERLGIAPAERTAFQAAARGLRAVGHLEVEAVPLNSPPSATPQLTERGGDLPKFVGRAEELRVLDQTFEHVSAGAGHIVLIAGQPGIGKTALAQAGARRARQSGMRVLWGRALEEPGAPPYWPWLQLVRAFLDQAEPAAAAAALGAGGRWIADIVPELADPLPNLPPAAASTDAAQARFRLFDAIAVFLKRAATTQGVVLVLDDLHWADVPSLRLLEFVAREISTTRLLIIGTYRDTEVDRRHPLNDALGAISGLARLTRIRLGGLDRDEVRELVASSHVDTDTADTDTADQLFERTEGHPLFLAQLARYVDEAGAAAGQGLPAGVREAIGARLNRLSERCNHVLLVAAVIGRDFELGVLAKSVDGLSEDECVTALEEALAARIVEEQSEADHYRFSHVLIRQTLYDELSTLRRQRLHLRIAGVLEAMHGDDVSRLAHHFAAAPPAESAAKAIEYARQASVRAMRLLAYEEAARHLRVALAISGRARSDDAAMRLGLLLRLGDSQTSAGEYSNARDSFRAAAELARDRSASLELAHAAIGFEDASWRPGLSGEESIGLLRDALAHIGEGDLRTRSRALGALTRALIFTGAADEAIETNARAIELARRLEDPGTLADALCSGLSLRWLPERLGIRIVAAHEAMLIGQRIGDKERVAAAASWRLFDLLEIGDTPTFFNELDAFAKVSEELRQPFWIYTAASFRPTLALMQGDLAHSEQAAHALRALGERQPGFDAAGVYATQMFTLRREQGRLRELAPLVRHFVQVTPAAMVWRPGLALVLSELGMADEARLEFERLAKDDFRALPRDGMWAACMAYLAEVCVFLADRVRARTIYTLLLPYQDRNIVAGTAMACFGSGARFLGMLAAVAGRWDDAERHLENALSKNTDQGARTWIAHTQASFATMLLARGHGGDDRRARALRDSARQSATTLGLAGLLAKLNRTDSAPNASASLGLTAGLNLREVDVLRLVADGKSDREIANALSLTTATVAKHLRSVLVKTGSSDRAQAASFAVRAGLCSSRPAP